MNAEDYSPSFLIDRNREVIQDNIKPYQHLSIIDRKPLKMNGPDDISPLKGPLKQAPDESRFKMRNFELETWFSQWEFTARYHMTASDIESMSISDLLSMGSEKDREEFEKLSLGYTETYGLPELREAIADTYDSADPEDILCFAGAEEGIYIAMRVLLGRNDHAIITVPNYQAAETLPLDICKVSGVPLRPDKKWSLDLNRVKKEIRPETRLISINFPNNPTGAVMDQRSFIELVDICRFRGIYLFSDEVYRMVELDSSIRLPQAGDIYERGISLNVMSKAYGLPGLRIGWIMTKDRDLLQRMERYKHYLSICNSAPSERLAIIALRERNKILGKNRALLRENLGKLSAFFEEFPDLLPGTARREAAYVFPNTWVPIKRMISAGTW